MRKNLYPHGDASGPSYLPVKAGGSGASNAVDALNALGGIPAESSALIPLNLNGKMDPSLIPASNKLQPMLNGPTVLHAGNVYAFPITNFDAREYYDLTDISNCTAVLSGEIITVTVIGGLPAGSAVSFSINGKNYSMAVS